MDARTRVTERAWRNGDPNEPSTPRPLLTLDEFFDGNTVAGSIGCNLDPTPTPAEFRELLESIRVRADVADVRVQITMFDDPDWPFSDTVWIITSAPPEQVRSWFPQELAPDDLWADFPADQSFEECKVPAGHRAVACWWD